MDWRLHIVSGIFFKIPSEKRLQIPLLLRLFWMESRSRGPGTGF